MEGGLAQRVERELSTLAAAWEAVELLVLFGSGGTAKINADSDVDLYLRLVHGSARDRSAEEAFVAAASRVCGREVDLVVESPSTSVILRREVAGKGRPLFERRPNAFRAFVIDAVRAYVDLEPQLRLIGDAVRARASHDGALARDRLVAAEAARGR